MCSSRTKPYGHYSYSGFPRVFLTYISWAGDHFVTCNSATTYSGGFCDTQSLTTRTHVFREYLGENEKFHDTGFACSISYGAQVELFDKKGRKFCDTVPLRPKRDIAIHGKGDVEYNEEDQDQDIQQETKLKNNKN